MAVFLLKLAVMDQNAKKLAVLRQLTAQTEPISLRALLEKLGDGYAERTVRRWLLEMIAEGLVEKSGTKRSSKYQAIPFPDHTPTMSCFSHNSHLIIAKVRRPIYERPPITYNITWFDAYHPNKTAYIPLQSRLALHKEGSRLKKEEPAGTYAHQIFNRLLIDLSYNSSRLEGNTYSLLDTQKLLL